MAWNQVLSFLRTNLFNGIAMAKVTSARRGMIMRNIQPHEMWPQPKFRAAIAAGEFGAGAGPPPKTPTVALPSAFSDVHDAL